MYKVLLKEQEADEVSTALAKSFQDFTEGEPC